MINKYQESLWFEAHSSLVHRNTTSRNHFLIFSFPLSSNEY